MSRTSAFASVVWRELQTVVRTRTYALLSVGLALVFVQLVRGGDAAESGYVPAAVDLLLPVEVLVPLVAVALGYRAFSGDNDDRPVLRTYPISRVALVGGVFVGRLVGLAAIVGVPLVAVAVLVSRTSGIKSAVFATHGGVDSPVLFARFVMLTFLFGAVVLAMAIAASILVQTSRAALALVLAVLIAVVVGGDLLTLVGLSTGAIDGDSLETALAASPASAYRGLVLELVVGVATDEQGVANVTESVVGLLGWLLASLLVTVAGVYRQPNAGSLRRLVQRLR